MTTTRILNDLALPKILFKKYNSIAVLVDENTRRYCYPKVKDQLPNHHVFEVQGGEERKNLETCKFLWQQFTDAHLDRHSLLLVLGGGVLGDMGGFCAATFKRGMDFCLLPTTLLSMADASIGGKTGVDFGTLKNHIGTFAMPTATWIYPNFLKTLPEAELRSGFAEVIKHSLISDQKMWETIRRKSLQQQDWTKLIRHSVGFKSTVVRKDPLEDGVRKILNYGHTVGHALEGYYLNSSKRLLHGEAIAAGMVIEAQIAFLKKLLKASDMTAIARYILSIFGKIDVPPTEKLLPAVSQDKKNRGKEILMALPNPIGKARWDIPVSEREIRGAIAYYRAIQT